MQDFFHFQNRLREEILVSKTQIGRKSLSVLHFKMCFKRFELQEASNWQEFFIFGFTKVVSFSPGKKTEKLTLSRNRTEATTSLCHQNTSNFIQRLKVDLGIHVPLGFWMFENFMGNMTVRRNIETNAQLFHSQH